MTAAGSPSLDAGQRHSECRAAELKGKLGRAGQLVEHATRDSRLASLPVDDDDDLESDGR